MFTAETLPLVEEGTIIAKIDFTHSKIAELEIKVWIKDLGPTFLAEGLKNTITEWQPLSSGYAEEIEIKGLSNLHFYSIGVDYRNPRSLGSKVNSSVIIEGYRYEAVVPKPALTAASPVEAPLTQPCLEPELRLAIEAEGYCVERDRPAVFLQCLNCQNREWAFSVEYSTPYEGWRPLRADGQRQAAFGLPPRNEPLCILGPGVYQLRVLAWGKECPEPVIYKLDMPAIIPEQPEKLVPRALPLSSQAAPPQEAALPDTLIVDGQAVLKGDIIKGMLELAPNPLFGDFRCYAQISYVHPGHRDITIDNLPLAPGQKTPFSIHLDAEDLKRGVHPVHVVVYVNSGSASGEVPLASLWIQTKMEASPVPATTPEALAFNQSAPPPTSHYAPRPASLTIKTPAAAADTETTAVTAACSQVQNLQLFQNPESPDQSVLLSWVNPDCCQEEGCAYTIWAGRSPNELRLLIDDQRKGKVVRELLSGLHPNENYFEVIVNTDAGIRKAACVRGFGPAYESAQPVAYQKPPEPASPVFTTGQLAAKGTPAATGFRWNDDQTASHDSPITAIEAPVPAIPNYSRPSHPIAGFEPCQYERETVVENNQPFQPGETITIRYDHSRPGYQYTLYCRPENGSEWVIAPGTKELQSSSKFTMTATPMHTGSYLILAFKSEKGWGCLSAPPSRAVAIRIMGN